jgi:transglutaminase-like putative cysteine protease
VPARFAIGLPLPLDRHAGEIAGYHCWAEFHSGTKSGWIPVDASEAAKDPARRDYFFGAHDEHSVELSKGRDVMLAPQQRGEPLNFFVNPYAETEDGKAFDGLRTVVEFRDLVRLSKP